MGITDPTVALINDSCRIKAYKKVCYLTTL